MIDHRNAQDTARWLQTHGCQRLRSDSRSVRTGDGFVAWSGAHVDARDFVIPAFEQGAQAALVEAHDLTAAQTQHWPPETVMAVPSLKTCAGDIAHHFYGRPSDDLAVVAITGTNGKTSMAWWLAHALQSLGQACGVIGTLGVGPIESLQPTGLTTPQAVELHDALAQMRDGGLRACAIEASSIGLAEHRLQGLHVRVAAFTNLSQDHLDYHGDMAHYWAAKQRLFTWPGLQTAVIHLDDAHGEQLATQLRARTAAQDLALWTFGRHEQARLRLIASSAHAQGQRLEIAAADSSDRHHLDTPFVGAYNAANLLGVIACLCALGHGLAQAVAACQSLPAVPGRLQAVAPQPNRPWVVVDYAHTPDAIAQVLRALQPLAQARQGRLWCVVGCGGERDASKRAPMAAAAEQGADRLILTSDNPRGEDPQAILDDMMTGLQSPAHAVCSDRAQAIAQAVASSHAHDVVLIAGKGHEDYQEVRGQRLPFSDHDVALAALQAWRPLEAQA